MDATQAISDSLLESDEEENIEENQNKRGRQLAKLCILKNPHLPETELPLFLGDNVLGRDPSICSLPLPASSVSKQHATICISVYRKRSFHNEVDMEALVWDLGSMNGTRKGRLKLTPNVRYALSEGDSLVLADIPCQYVSCSARSVSSQDDMKTPGSRNLRIKTKPSVLPDGLGVADRVGMKCVNGGRGAKKSSVRGSCLSFEQTPTQPQGSLVPDSDSDSDCERGGRGDGRQKTQVSDFDSLKSSPNSSGFLSPPNKTVPESEDESPIPPSSSANSNRRVSFSTEKSGVDVDRRHLKKNTSLGFVENSGEEEEEEEKATGDGTNTKQSGPDVKQESNVSLTEDESLVSTPGVVPAFNMDSDTDEEGEGRPADQPANTAPFHMDSDTDVDEDIPNKSPKTVSGEAVKPTDAASGIQPDDSDTDVDDAAVSEVIIAVKATSSQADSASSKDFHLDSDTDVEEEGEAGRGTRKDSKAEEMPDVSGSVTTAAPLSLNPETKTEPVCGPASGDLSGSLTSPAAAADLNIVSDSDTDAEEQDVSLLVGPLDVPNVSDKMSGSDVETDLDEPGAGDASNPAELGGDSDTGLEDEEANIGEDQIPKLKREHTGSLGSLTPLLQNCSTPVQVSEEVENMETQAFISPSSVAFGRELKASALTPIVPSSCSDSQEDEDYAVAETQSFLLQTRDQQTGVHPNPASGLWSKPADRSNRADSFQLGLSDSSHLQCQENTQALESAGGGGGGGVNLEETQAYISAAYKASAENFNLEETQPYEENKDSEKEDCANLAFEATQAYVSEPYDDPEKDLDDTRQNAAEAQTADFTDRSSTLAMAETLPLLFFEEERLETSNSIYSAHVKPRTQTETKEKILSEAVFIAETQPMCTVDNKDDEDFSSALEEKETQPYTCSTLSLAETQPMHVGAAETQPMVIDEDDEYSMPLMRKRKAKQLHVEEEESDQLTDSNACIAQTQPIVASDEEEDDDSVPGPHKRKAKPLQLDDETQSLGNSEASAVECEGKPSDEESFIPRKRKAKPLPVEEEQTQPLIGSQVSGVSSQPEVRGAEEENDSEVLVLPRKRKAKQLHLEDEETQQLNSSELSSAEIQPDTAVNPQTVETHDEEQTPPLTSTEVSAAEAQLIERDKKSDEDTILSSQTEKQHHPDETEPSTHSEILSAGTLTKTDETDQSGTSKSRQTKVKLVQEKEELECSVSPKRRTRKENKTLPKTKGRRGKAEDDDGEEELKRARGRINARLQEDDEEKEMGDGERQEGRGTLRRRGELQNKGKAKKEMEDAKRIKPDLKSVEKDGTRSEEATVEEHKVRLEREKKQEHQTELQTEKEAKEKQLRGEEEKLKVPARGRKSTRKTTSAPGAAELEPNSSVSTSEDFPARRTRSRSNSSNSISSEKSASSVGPREPLQTPVSRSSRRRVTVVAGPAEQNSCRARGGRQQGRGRKILLDASSSETLQNNYIKESHSQQAATSRGQQKVNANESKPSVLNDEGQSSQEKSPPPKRNVRGRGQKAARTANMEEPVAPVNNADEGRNRRNRKKTELETDPNVDGKVSKDGVQKTADEDEKDEQKHKIPATVQVRRTGRASSAQTKKNVKEPPQEEVEDGDQKKVEAAEKKPRGRTSVVQKSKKEELKEAASSTKQTVKVETSKQPQTPTSNVSRKRQTSSDSSPLAKTPRSSSGSPAASGRLRAGSKAYKVLFTGVVDETGERVLTRLGGSMAKGVVDMNCLVTDKVRRTVKFLCAVAKGVPVVTTDWLEKSGKAGSFLSPHAFIVQDPEQEKKFSFCLQDSLEAARSQPLLQGYEIHVTKSVKPEPVHMKEIVCCSGAVFLPKMPSSHKPQTVVISCEDDWRLCGPAVSASLPVVTAEFLLTGILQQKRDFQTHALSPAANSQPAGDRGRSKRKT